jgi:nucleotide-binding universal stress UspA family protein
VTGAKRDAASVTLIAVARDALAEAARWPSAPVSPVPVSQEEADAILLGARGVGRIAALMGSVSQHVLHHAQTAVFVAHAPRGTREEDAADDPA